MNVRVEIPTPPSVCVKNSFLRGGGGQGQKVGANDSGSEPTVVSSYLDVVYMHTAVWVGSESTKCCRSLS